MRTVCREGFIDPETWRKKKNPEEINLVGLQEKGSPDRETESSKALGVRVTGKKRL